MASAVVADTCARMTFTTDRDRAEYTNSSPDSDDDGNTSSDDLSLGDNTHSPRGLSAQSTVASARRDSRSKMCSFVASTTTMLRATTGGGSPGCRTQPGVTLTATHRRRRATVSRVNGSADGATPPRQSLTVDGS